MSQCAAHLSHSRRSCKWIKSRSNYCRSEVTKVCLHKSHTAMKQMCHLFVTIVTLIIFDNFQVTVTWNPKAAQLGYNWGYKQGHCAWPKSLQLLLLSSPARIVVSKLCMNVFTCSAVLYDLCDNPQVQIFPYLLFKNPFLYCFCIKNFSVILHLYLPIIEALHHLVV